MIDRLANRVIQGYSTTVSDLVWTRRIYAVTMLLFFLPRGLFLTDLPRSFLDPPVGLTQLGAMLPLPVAVPAANVLAACLAGMLLFGVAVRFTSVALSVALLALNSMQYATGKIDHDIVLVLMPLVMANVWDEKADGQTAGQERRPWQLGCLALLAGLVMATAGAPKALTGWPELSSHAVLGHCVRSVEPGRFAILLEPMLRWLPLWSWELQDWVTIVFELSLLPAAFFPWLFRRLLLVSVAFHVGVWLQMDITWPYQYPVYAAFAPWRCLFGAARSFTWPVGLRGAVGVALGAGVAYVGVTRGFPLLEMNPIATGRGWLLSGGLLTLVLAGAYPWWRLRGDLGISDGEAPGVPPTIFFDGVCGLCNKSVDFVLARDRDDRFRFASLQSDLAHRVLKEHGVDASDLASVALVQNGKMLRKSDAVLAVAGQLSLPWRLMTVALLVPRPLRDAAYTLVAKSRYSIFGQSETCRMPTEAEKEKFLAS